MTSAAAATSSMGMATTMNTMIAPVAAKATYGVVSKRAWTLAKPPGSTLSRPIANDTRVDEYVVAFSAEIVDNSPPHRITIVPYGMKPSAAKARPSSRCSPRNRQAVCPPSGVTAPIAVIATST